MRALALIPFVPALMIAADLGGITTVAWVMVAHMAGLTVVVSLIVRARAGVALRDQLRAVAPPAVGALVAWLAARGTANALDDAAPVVALLVSGLACVAAYAAAASAVEPRLLPDALARARARAAAPGRLARRGAP